VVAWSDALGEAICARVAGGEMKVVAYCPNPVTGEVEREDAPGWESPAGTVGMPGGWDLYEDG
jgi:hypothetical protein